MKTIFFLTILILIVGCEKGAVDDMGMYLYKTKDNYSDRVVVELSNEKSKVLNVFAPEEQDTWPMSLTNDYWLNGVYGANETAYLSLTNTQYNENPSAFSKDSLYKLIVDSDPFIEFYTKDDGGIFYHNGLDTIKLNNMIRNNEIEEYFIRTK